MLTTDMENYKQKRLIQAIVSDALLNIDYANKALSNIYNDLDEKSRIQYERAKTFLENSKQFLEEIGKM